MKLAHYYITGDRIVALRTFDWIHVLGPKMASHHLTLEVRLDPLSPVDAMARDSSHFIFSPRPKGT